MSRAPVPRTDLHRYSPFATSVPYTSNFGKHHRSCLKAKALTHALQKRFPTTNEEISWDPYSNRPLRRRPSPGRAQPSRLSSSHPWLAATPSLFVELGPRAYGVCPRSAPGPSVVPAHITYLLRAPVGGNKRPFLVLSLSWSFHVLSLEVALHVSLLDLECSRHYGIHACACALFAEIPSRFSVDFSQSIS